MGRFKVFEAVKCRILYYCHHGFTCEYRGAYTAFIYLFYEIPVLSSTNRDDRHRTCTVSVMPPEG